MREVRRREEDNRGGVEEDGNNACRVSPSNWKQLAADSPSSPTHTNTHMHVNNPRIEEAGTQLVLNLASKTICD